jgi:F-type H+-transporting ATPase subunit b
MLAFPPDYTFLVQLGSFFVLLYLMNRLVFAPFAALLNERDERTAGDQEAARADREEADAMAARIEAQLAETRASAHAEVETLRRSTRAEEARIFASARDEAAARLSELRASLDAAKRDAMTSLRDDAQDLAARMVSVVLRAGGARR